MGGKLGPDGLVIGGRILRRAVDEVKENAASLDMAEEAVAGPAPSCAPSMRPGMSASTNSRFAILTTPRFGCSVVKG
jgi:hypothetical protein